jgi:hypothetical protein
MQFIQWGRIAGIAVYVGPAGVGIGYQLSAFKRAVIELKADG